MPGKMNLVGIACYTLILFLSVEQTILVSEQEFSVTDSLFVEADTLNIMCVGDLMLGTDYPSKIYLPPGGDCSHLLENVKNHLVDADITCGNLEGTFAGTEGKPKKCKDTTMCFVFRMPDAFVECLVEAGFDFLSLANNHNGDFGYTGRARTHEILENAGVKTAGLLDHPTSMIVQDGITYGFCAFSPHPGTLDLKNLKQADLIIRGLDSICDIVIVSFHGGAEGSDHQNVTREDEVYLGYNRGNVYEFSMRAIEAGADVVFGHGPHVSRAVQIYQNRLIMYSLGNFCTYARFNLRGPNGFAPMINVSVDRQGNFLEAKIYPVRQVGRGIPEIDPSARVISIMRELTETDFPDAGIRILEDGMIRYNRTEEK